MEGKRRDRVREVEVEVLPPDEGRAGEDPLAALIARLMDNVFTLPGTKVRFGLDPLLGLLPGLGDSFANVISTYILLRGARAGVPRIVLVRMAANILLNALIGAIPGLGDLFSFWFKSNQRNYHLLVTNAGRSRSTGADWIFVGAIVASLLAIVGGVILLFAAALSSLIG
jgi:Domain of unknown function (DUF4112)